VRSAQSHLTGVGGLRIFWQAWLPDADPRAIVAISHGAGEHSGRYEHVATRLVADGYAVYAIDHRGHGRSEGPRALIDRLDSAAADLDALIVHATWQHPATPVFLLAHSMGATIALRYCASHEERLAGLILSGALAAIESAPAAQRIVAGILSRLAPGLGLITVDPALVSRDPAVVSAYTEDPLVHHGKLPARTVTEFAAAIDSFPDEVRTITIPVLIMYGTADTLCPTQGSVMLDDRLGSTDKTLRPYEGLYHEILNEPEQDAVLDDVCDWIAAHVAVRAC
jgi:acylglycerol lipase